MQRLLESLISYLAQLSLVVIPVYVAYWLNHRK